MKTNYRIYPHQRKLGWLLPINKLPALYEIFLNSGKINCRFSEFIIHFVGPKPYFKEIRWLSSGAEFIHVFSALIDNGVIPYRQDYVLLLAEHFVQRDGQPLNVDSLYVLKSRVPNVFVDRFIEQCISLILDDNS